MSASSGVCSVTTSLRCSSSSSDTYSASVLGASVMGEHPAAEPAQPLDHGRADASRSDDPDGQVAQLPPAHFVQSVVVELHSSDGGLGVSYRHQHQHQRVVGHAVG